MSAVYVPVTIRELPYHEFYRLRLPLPTRVKVAVIDGKLRFYHNEGARRVMLMPRDFETLWRHTEHGYAANDANHTAYLSLDEKTLTVRRLYLFTPHAHLYFLDELERAAMLGDLL